MSVKQLGRALCAFTAVSLVGAATASADTITLRAGHVLETTHGYHVGLEYFAERMAELTDGRVEVRVFPNSQLGNEMAMLEGLDAGTLDLAITAAANASPFVPELGFFSVSYLFDDEPHFRSVLHDETFNALLDEKIEASGFEFTRLATFTAGLRHAYTRDREISSLEDLSGVRMRVMASPVESDVWSELGTLPTSVPWGEVYTALQTGMVDGAENAIGVYASNRHFEVAPYYSLTGHQWLMALLVVSHDTWNDLPEDVREAMLTVSAELTDYIQDYVLENDAAFLDELRGMGVTVTEVDTTPFMEQLGPLQDRKAEELGMTDVLERIRELR